MSHTHNFLVLGLYKILASVAFWAHDPEPLGTKGEACLRLIIPAQQEVETARPGARIRNII